MTIAYKAGEEPRHKFFVYQQALESLETKKKKQLFKIITYIIDSFNNALYTDLLKGFSLLNSFIRANDYPIELLNEHKFNQLFNEFFHIPQFQPFFENVLRPLNILVATSKFDITPFENTDFFLFFIENVIIFLKEKSNGIEFLSNIIYLSNEPILIFMQNGVLSKIIDLFNKETSETVKFSCFKYISSLCKSDPDSSQILDEVFPQLFSILRRSMIEQINQGMPARFLEYLSVLQERTSSENIYIILKGINISPFIVECGNMVSEEYQQAVFTIVEFFVRFSLLQKNEISWEHFEFVFSSEFSDDLVKSFLKMGSILILYQIQYLDPNYENPFMNLILDTINERSFKVKKEAFRFLFEYVKLNPSIIVPLVENGFLCCVSQYIEAVGHELKYTLISTLNYILCFYMDNQMHIEFIQAILEDDLLDKITEIDVEDEVPKNDHSISNQLAFFWSNFNEVTKMVQLEVANESFEGNEIDGDS
ncbi:hypothetical protein TRFO_16666 [Tritrichomonas foetus]|uniref:Uncharacterized protein n=1 Tax=Tritrichomonas foetus TaxID=1144522 RepID=A0A1J4KTY5_9EUKA|nr:hypothetical protein TRFO_16666 [Tritrichomonas foetus]|eukprot:OHT13228.1 hypothetical protein TRFO_16666 [Tritrichomonas foetus]